LRRSRRWEYGRQTLGHDLKQVVEFGKLCGGQEREHLAQGLSPGTPDLSQQTSAFVA